VFGLRDMLGNLAYVLEFVSVGLVLDALGVLAVFAVGGVAMVSLAVVVALRFGLTPYGLPRSMTTLHVHKEV
jgi:hypothetical protein